MRRLLAAALLAVALVAGLIGYAAASIPSSDGRIHGCWSGLGDDKNFRLLDNDQADGECPFGWTEVSWAAD
jgi:hypothetical protein